MSNSDLLLGREPLETRVPRKRQRAPQASEAAIQRAILDWCRWHRIYAAHIPNAGPRSIIAGRRLKGEGMRKGFPDLALYGPGGRHALLEVKRPGFRPSDVSEAQREVHERLRELGATVAIVTGPEDAEQVLRAAGWPL